MIDTDDAAPDTRSGDDPRAAHGPTADTPAALDNLAVVHDLRASRPLRPAGGRLVRLAHRQAEDAGRSVRVQALERLGR